MEKQNLSNTKERSIEMKKVLSLVLVTCIICSLCSCGGGLNKCVESAYDTVRDLNMETPYGCSFTSEHIAKDRRFVVYCYMPASSGVYAELTDALTVSHVQSEIEPIFDEIFKEYREDIDIVICYVKNGSSYAFYINGNRIKN